MRYQKCPFCENSDSPPSAEDVFPKWMARELARIHRPTKKMRLIVQGGQGHADPDEEWGAPKGTLGIIVTMPCERCNNGWMSQLETAVLPIFTDLINGRPRLIKTDEQLIVARWAVKTAMVYEYFRRHSPRYYRPSDRRAFYKQRIIPSGTGLWLGRYVGDVATQAYDPSEMLTFVSKDRNILGQGYVFTIGVGQLTLQLFSHRWSENLDRAIRFTMPGVWDRALVEIWPNSFGNRQWPPRDALDDVAMNLLADRFLSARATWLE